MSDDGEKSPIHAGWEFTAVIHDRKAMAAVATDPMAQPSVTVVIENEREALCESSKQQTLDAKESQARAPVRNPQARKSVSKDPGATPDPRQFQSHTTHKGKVVADCVDPDDVRWNQYLKRAGYVVLEHDNLDTRASEELRAILKRGRRHGMSLPTILETSECLNMSEAQDQQDAASTSAAPSSLGGLPRLPSRKSSTIDRDLEALDPSFADTLVISPPERPPAPVNVHLASHFFDEHGRFKFITGQSSSPSLRTQQQPTGGQHPVEADYVWMKVVEALERVTPSSGRSELVNHRGGISILMDESHKKMKGDCSEHSDHPPCKRH